MQAIQGARRALHLPADRPARQSSFSSDGREEGHANRQETGTIVLPGKLLAPSKYRQYWIHYTCLGTACFWGGLWVFRCAGTWAAVLLALRCSKHAFALPWGCCWRPPGTGSTGSAAWAWPASGAACGYPGALCASCC